MFGMLFSYSIFGLPFVYGLLGFIEFASLVWNTVTISIRFLLLVEVVSEVWLCVYVKLSFSCSQQQECS